MIPNLAHYNKATLVWTWGVKDELYIIRECRIISSRFKHHFFSGSTRKTWTKTRRSVFKCRKNGRSLSRESSLAAELFLNEDLPAFLCLKTLFSKGQLILKWFFGVIDFLQKTNENKLTWGIIVVKSNLFVRFLEEIDVPKNNFEISWPLVAV